MSRYKVVEVKTERWEPENPVPTRADLTLAENMKSKYGLPFSAYDIASRWLLYSESLFSGWLLDFKERVEYVFDVKLEKLDD